MQRRSGMALLLRVMLLVPAVACKPRSIGEAEAKRDIHWLAADGTPPSVASLGRLADSDPRALAELEKRAAHDVNTYIASWTAITRNAPWGGSFLRSGLADATRAELAATALPRRDARLIPFTGDLESAVTRLPGHGASVLAGILASIGPQAHAAVERRLVDPKTRGAMCDGIGGPETSSDAKSVLVSVPPEARDHRSCITTILTLAEREDSVVEWLATGAEPGLLNAAAKGSLGCPRVAAMWKRGLGSRPTTTHAALIVPLERSIERCGMQLDPVLAELLVNSPRTRTAIVQAIDPFKAEVAELKLTCTALQKGVANRETPRVRGRARDAVTHGCALAR